MLSKKLIFFITTITVTALQGSTFVGNKIDQQYMEAFLDEGINAIENAKHAFNSTGGVNIHSSTNAYQLPHTLNFRHDQNIFVHSFSK